MNIDSMISIIYLNLDIVEKLKAGKGLLQEIADYLLTRVHQVCLQASNLKRRDEDRENEELIATQNGPENRVTNFYFPTLHIYQLTKPGWLDLL